jgi:hypothetical protein
MTRMKALFYLFVQAIGSLEPGDCLDLEFVTWGFISTVRRPPYAVRQVPLRAPIDFPPGATL